MWCDLQIELQIIIENWRGFISCSNVATHLCIVPMTCGVVLYNNNHICDLVHGILCEISNGVCLIGRLVVVRRVNGGDAGDMSTSEPPLAWRTTSKSSSLEECYEWLGKGGEGWGRLCMWRRCCTHGKVNSARTWRLTAEWKGVLCVSRREEALDYCAGHTNPPPLWSSDW